MSSCRETADEIQEKLLDMGFTVHRLDSFTTNSVYLKSRDDNGYGSMLAGYDFGRNEGVGKCQLHEAAKMLRREILNLDNMLGEQQ